MITYLIGEVVSVTEKRLVLDVNQVGFQIAITTRDAQNMPPKGSKVQIYTYMSVREDAISLFGFLSEDDLNMYKMLINVSGIGPKGGLGILSVMSADDLRFAVLSSDAKAIARAPGIGQKTAQKLILEIKDKIDLNDVLNRSDDAETPAVTQARAEMDDAVAALSALGYSASDALRAVRKVTVSDEMTTQEIIRKALPQLSGL